MGLFTPYRRARARTATNGQLAPVPLRFFLGHSQAVLSSNGAIGRIVDLRLRQDPLIDGVNLIRHFEKRFAVRDNDDGHLTFHGFKGFSNLNFASHIDLAADSASVINSCAWACFAASSTSSILQSSRPY